ncbi:hypothetical protein EVAR_92159_1 [Eumeta japonica]|uniref:Uncharacterized protein n=1 Tax=Eumeta variegata TaxID=151549 RepID=A0A4C1SYL9_EUMVA|nr:hypothetical protein EVAR_92159_1 [Eumeta japonica]
MMKPSTPGRTSTRNGPAWRAQKSNFRSEMKIFLVVPQQCVDDHSLRRNDSLRYSDVGSSVIDICMRSRAGRSCRTEVQQRYYYSNIAQISSQPTKCVQMFGNPEYRT